MFLELDMWKETPLTVVLEVWKHEPLFLELESKPSNLDSTVLEFQNIFRTYSIDNGVPCQLKWYLHALMHPASLSLIIFHTRGNSFTPRVAIFFSPRAIHHLSNLRLGKLQSASDWISFKVKKELVFSTESSRTARCFNFGKKLMVMKTT